MENNKKVIKEEKQIVEKVQSTDVKEKTSRPARFEKGAKKGPSRNTRKPREDRFEERVVSINRVAKTVKGGRKIRFAALVVVGDGKGTVGFGTGKANEVPDAIKKAIETAKNNLFKVAMVKGDTFPYEVIGRQGAVKVFMKPAPDGTGIIAGGPVRAVLELAGVKNIYSKVYGSRNPINIVRATINGIEYINKVNKVTAVRRSSIAEVVA